MSISHLTLAFDSSIHFSHLTLLANQDAQPPEWRFIYIAAMVISAVIVGIAKSGFGGGIGILAVPLVASVVEAQQMLALLIIPFFMGDLIAVYQHRKNMREPQAKRYLKITMTGMCFGILLGALTLILFGRISELDFTLRLMVGITCLFFVGLQCYRLMGGKTPQIPDTSMSGVGCGIFVSFVSTVTNAAGPLMQIYLMEHKMPKKILVCVPSLYFCLNNGLKIIVFSVLGYLDATLLWHASLFALCVPIGSLLGIYMHHRVPERLFTVIVYVCATLAAANMIYSAFS